MVGRVTTDGAPAMVGRVTTDGAPAMVGRVHRYKQGRRQKKI